MGLNNGSDMIATISELSLNDVILILNKIDRNTGALHETRIDMADTTERINTYPVSHLQLLRADIDVSWILRKITKHSDTVKCKVEKTAAFLHVLQSNGFIVTPICDPDHRHSSKRDSFRRRADSIKKDIKIRAARFKLLSISEKIKSATLNGEDTSLLEVEKKEVRKTAKLENNFNEIPPNFPYQLHNHFQKNDMYDDNGILGSITAVQTGMYQADLAIARRHNSHVNESDVIFGNDGDFAMYVGREMIQIRNFIFDAKKGEIKSIALGFASNKLAALAKDVLEEFKTKSKFVTELAATTNSSKTGKCKKNVHEASNSATTVQNKDQQISLDLFAQYDDLEIRALIGFGCGCDVYKGGVPGLGPTTLARHISNMSETERTHIKNTLKSLYAERLKTDILTIEAFIQAIVYEPAHVLNVEKLSEECENEFQYVGDAPTLLTKYCKDFCMPPCTIMEVGPEVFSCKGYDSLQDHFYLSVEKRTCSICGEDKCRHCMQVEKDSEGGERELCLKCFKSLMLEGICDTDTEGRQQMIDEIQKSSYGGGYAFINDCTMDEIQSIYHTNVVQGKMIIDVSSVQYPLASPENFQNESAMEFLGEFDIYSEGGSFISKPELVSYLPSILEYFAKTVTFDSTIRFTLFDSPVYKSIPSYITTMASKCRRDSGYRLCVRCLRHSTDPKYLPTEMSKVRVVKVACNEEGGEKTKIAFDWSTMVPASMLSSKYSSRSCVTYEGELYACRCTCKVGGDKQDATIHGNISEKHAACVHILPNVMKLSMVVTDFIADDLCRELENMFRTNIVSSKFSENEIKSIERSTRALAIVALTDCDICISTLMNMDLHKMLEKHFGVGTNRAKNNNVTAYTLEHIPISKLKKKSVVSAAAAIFKREVGSTAAEDNCCVFEKLAPDYERISQEVACFHDTDNDQHFSFAGFKLLLLRANCSGASDLNNFQSDREEWEATVEVAMLRTKKRNQYNNSRPQQVSPNPEGIKRPKLSERVIPVIRKYNLRNNKRKVGGQVGGKTTYSFTCQFPGCKNDSRTKNIRWHKVPSLKKYPKTAKAYSCVRNFHIQKKFRFVVLDRLASVAKTMHTPRWCSVHEAPAPHLDSVVFQFNGENRREMFPFAPVPINSGPKQKPASTSKGVAIDRYNTGFLNSLDSCQHLAISLAQKAYSPHRQNSKAASEVLPTLENSATLGTPRRIVIPHATVVTPGCDDDVIQEPVVKPGMKDSEVKRRTGFVSEKAMLMYIVLMYNGDLQKMKATISTMTWYEEKFAYFERTWGQTIWREIDFEQEYKLDRRTLRDVFDNILEAELTCRRSWPTFCSYDEDIRLCSEQWRHKYVDRRIIMWDDTNIPFQYKPTLAHEQRLTFSQYYNQNCGKAAVFLQRNGWVGTSESVWTGGITDSSVMISKDQDEREALDHAADEPHSILGRQLNFQRNDLVDGEVKPFHNILDKGYRISQEAARNHQFIIQPNFTNATQRFKGEEVLCIAEVASDRSANERGVRVVKRSAYITDGVETNASFERMEKVAKAFSFRCNFMFKPVL